MTQIKKTEGAGYLTQYAEEDHSLDTLKEYRVLSRAAIVQGLSSEALKDEHGEGAAVLTPGGSRIAKKQEAFLFVPLFHYTEFIKWSDRKDSASPAVVERSFDPQSELAHACRDADRRIEPYGGGSSYEYRNVEHIVFAGIIYGHDELGNSPVAIGFSKGEFFQGKNFASACMQRTLEGGVRAPLWAQIWEFSTRLRERGTNKWYGFDFRNPDGDIFVSEEEAPEFLAMHNMLKEEFDAQRLRTDDSELAGIEDDEDSEM